MFLKGHSHEKKAGTAKEDYIRILDLNDGPQTH
jgi:hypothetical protein